MLRQLQKVRSSRILGALICLFVLQGAAVAKAASASEIASALQARYWYQDLGTFDANRPFGVMYKFGGKITSRPGWYTGIRTDFSGSVSYATTRGFAWQPGTNSVIMDFASSRQTVRFTGFSSQYEIFQSNMGYWCSTRSPYTPAIIRSYFWK